MISIVKATPQDAVLLSQLAAQTFIASHKASTTEANIAEYVANKYNVETIHQELQNPDYHYYILYYGEKVAGYSKIIFEVANPNIAESKVAKLDRLYFLEEFYGLKLGKQLFEFNVQLAKAANQAGMWLFVWTGNERAVAFYRKLGFVQVGNRAFPITATYSNPNYELYLKF